LMLSIFLSYQYFLRRVLCKTVVGNDILLYISQKEKSGKHNHHHSTVLHF